MIRPEPMMIVDGDWWQTPRGWRDVIRCLLGRHLASTCAFIDGMIVSRCSCGAIRLDLGHWSEAHPWERR